MRIVKSIVSCICILMVFTAQFGVSAAEAVNAGVKPEIILENKAVYEVDLVDSDRVEGKLIVYTRNYGECTRPFTGNTHEIVVVNNIVVYKNPDGASGTSIPSNGYVVSYTGSDAGILADISVGMELVPANINIPALPDMYFKINGMTIPIDGINGTRGSKQVLLYNQYFGKSTKTNGWGMELAVANNRITGIADITNVKGVVADNNSSIPSGGVVLSVHSGNPYYSLLHGKVKVGDNISVYADNYKLYSASKNIYAAYNPRTLQDNPLAWDAANGKPYGGFRGPNQLVVYDSGYCINTGTNPYGYEVAVNNEGKIIGRGGNDSEMPVGGYILSGHGDKGKWLEKYALLGATVILDRNNKAVTLVFTPASYTDMARYSVKTARESLDLARKQYLDIAYGEVQSRIYSAQSKLDNLQKCVEQGEYKDLSSKVNEIRDEANTAYYMTFESVKVENRAVWIRPLTTSTDEIRKQLDMLKGMNINTIYLETYWGGYSIYPTTNEVITENSIYNGLDILGIYIKEAHSRGIEVHAWVEALLTNPNIAQKHPEWLAVSRNSHYYQLEGSTKFYFMNPVLPKVRDFLSGMYKELVKKYDLDGIQFDYMRYPHSGNYSDDFGYDTNSRQLFKSFTGTDPIKLKPGDALWQEWCDFRTDKVSAFAYRIISEVRSIKPDIQISADVWPDYEKTPIDIYQDPKSWTTRGYINSIIPMSYYLSEAPVIKDIKNTWEFAKGYSQVNVGIATYTGVDKNVFVRQIDAARDNSTNGVAIFDYQSLFRGGYESSLKLGVFKTPAAVTYKDPEKAVDTLLKDIARKIDDIYEYYHAMNEEQAESYKKAVNDIKADFVDDTYNTDKAENLKRVIMGLLNNINSDENLNGEVAKRMSADLNRTINIIDGYVSGSKFLTAHQVRRFQVELPLDMFDGKKEAPIEVKAIFNDGAVIYLDSTQYAITSSNPAAARVTGGKLVITEGSGSSKIGLDILDTFRFATEMGVSKKIEFMLDPDSEVVVEQSALGKLIASDTEGSGVELSWQGTISNPAVAGYAVYRNGTRIATVAAESYTDMTLLPGTVYTYEIQGFDVSGRVIYTTNQLTH